MPPTGVMRTRTAARLVGAAGGGVPPPPPVDRFGAEGAGRVGAGAAGAPVVEGAAVVGTVDDVVSGVVASEGDGPTARSR